MTDPTTPPAPPPYSDHGATTPDRIAAETTRRVAEQAAHEQMRAEFLRDLADPAQAHAPLFCYPPTVGGRAPASCCTPALPVEPDDRVTDDLRDLVASQCLAMASARTKQGVAMAAMVVLTAAKGDAISDAIARGLRTVLGGVGDLFDGVDLDGMVRQAMAQYGVPAPAPAQASAGEGESVTIGVQVDGKTVGTATVPVGATTEDVIEVIRRDALLMAKVGDRQVTDVEYVPGKIVRVTTAPAAG